MTTITKRGSAKTIFPKADEVKIPRGRFTIYKNALASWDHLKINGVNGKPPTIMDIKRLIVVEAGNSNRPYILTRLIGKLHSMERAELYGRLGL